MCIRDRFQADQSRGGDHSLPHLDAQFPDQLPDHRRQDPQELRQQDQVFRRDFGRRKKQRYERLLSGLQNRTGGGDVYKRQRRYTAVSLPIASLYAITDEVHQRFVPGRSCQAADWAIDTAGAALGLLCEMCIRDRTSPS